MQIVVVDDQYVVVDRHKDVPQDNDSDEDFDESETDDDYDSDEEARLWRQAQHEAQDGSPVGGKKRRRRVRRKDGASSDEDADSDTERQELAAPGSLERQKLPRALRKHRWKSYYGRGTFRGQPVSYSMWQLVSHLHLERNDMLWLAIVGVTYAKLQSKLEADLYANACDTLERAVLVLNDPGRADRPGPVSSSSRGGGGASAALAAGLPAALAGGLVQGQAAVFDENGELVQAAGSAAATEVDPLVDGVAVMPAARLGFIRANDELNLFLHRHSTLFEAMRLSPYLGPRLKLWANDDDDRQLKKLLASSNVPLKDALTPWPHMKGRSKTAVMQQLVPTAQNLPTAQLDDLLYRSFTRQMGYDSPIGAADVAYAAAALIECARAQTITRAEEDARSNGEAAAIQQQQAGGGGGDAPPRSSDAGGPQEEVSWRDNFWAAYEALSSKSSSSSLLQRGIELALEIQRSIVRLGPYLVRTTHHFTMHGAVRTCKLAELKDSDRAIFTQPEALCRLGRFVIDHFQKVKRQWDRTPGAPGVTSTAHVAKPLVMLALNAETSYYTVVGLSVASRDEEDTSAFSQLSEVMRAAGQEAGARFVMDTFDSACVWLHKNYVDAFLDHLCFRVVHGFDAAANTESLLRGAQTEGGAEEEGGDSSDGGSDDGGGESDAGSNAGDLDAMASFEPGAAGLNTSGSTGASPESAAAGTAVGASDQGQQSNAAAEEDLSEAAVLALLEQLDEENA